MGNPFDVQYGATAVGPWTTFATVTNETQLGNPCITKSHTLNPPAGALYIRWSATWQAGDYYLNFDNITLTEVATPCSGTPTPGNTTATVATACPGANFSVGLQNATSGTGVTYLWESDNGGGWTTFGTSAPTQTVSQSVATSYRCTVTCTEPGGGANTSTPISVPMSAPFPVDFAPATFPSNCWTATANANLLRSTVNAYAAPGTGAAQWNYYNTSANTILTITSPVFTAIGGGQQIRFDVAGTTYTLGEIDSITVETSANGGTTWAVLQGMSNNTGGLLNTAPPQGANFVPTAAQWNTLTFALPAGVNMVRFRGRSAYGNSVYIDNIAIEPVPTCLPATSVSAVGLSSTSASVSWSGTGTFIVEYGPAATFTIPGTDGNSGPEATSTVVTGITGNTYTIPGLTHPTQYRVFVRKDCTGTSEGYSTNSMGVLFYTRPPYDECQSIVSIPSVAPGGTILLSGNNFGATDTEGFGASVSWEAFTLTSCATTLNIDYCGSTPARTNAFVNLFMGCPQAGFIPWTGSAGPACPNGSVNVPYANVPPGTYYIAVMNQAGASGPYGINVTAGAACPPPPPNDLCSSAETITCGQTLTGTNVNATTTGVPGTLCNGMLNNTSGGVWYMATGICGPVSASLCTTSPTWDSKLAVYSGSCGALVCVTTNDDFCAPLSQVSWTANADETYYLYVLGYNEAAEGPFTLSLTCTNTPVLASATNTDDCLNNQFSVPVTVTDLGGAASVTVNYSVNGTAQTPISGVGLGVTTLGPFASTAEVSVNISNGATGCTADLGSFFSNCPVTIACASPATVVNYCYRNNDTKTWTFINDTPGETITVSFVSGNMAPGDVIRFYDGTDNTGLQLAGSNYPDLTNVTVTTSLGVGEMFIEVESIGAGSCADGDPLASPWQFEVECTAGCLDPNGAVTPNVTCATYSFTLDVEVFDTGDAPTVDLVYTVDGGSPTVIPGLDLNSGIQNIGPFTIGSIVNVVLEHATDNACDKNLGNFQPGMACPPPGTSCALPFVVNSYPFTQSNTTCGKGNDVIGTQCGLGANYGGGEDFIYQLNVSSAGDYQISLQLTGGASFAGWFLKSSTNCNNAGQCLANAVTTVANGTASAIVTLAVGTYYVIVDSRPLPNCVGYNISITPFVFLPGDNCNNAIALTPGATCVPTAGSVAGMTQTMIAGTCGGTADDDMWYSFVATSANHDVILDADFDAVLEVRNGACNGANLACADNNFSTGIEQLNLNNLTIGATYYVRFWSWSSAVQATPTFDICVVEGVAPVDPCSTIAPISACEVPTGAVVSTTGNGAFDNYGGPWTTPGQERIFTFTATATGTHQINVTSLTGGWTDFFWKAAGTCDATGWNYVDDVFGAGVVIPSGTPLNFTTGTTYYIMWDAEDTGGRTVDFTVMCPPSPPANETCATASVLTLGVAGTCPANAVTGNNGAAVQDGPDPACDVDGPWPDVWYVFNAGSNASVNVDFTNISMGDIVVDVFDGSCAGASIYCGFGATDFQLTGLTANTNYYIRVSSNVAYGAGGAHSVCVSVPPPPPANDLCANAIPVVCNSVTNSTTVASTTIGAPADCNGLSLNTAGGIWYTVQGWDGPITVDLSGSSFDTKIGVFTGTCGDLVCVDSDDDDGAGLTSLVTFTGSASETYYLYVTGYPTNTGTVVMTVTCGSNNPACTENGLTLEVETDANFSQTSWEIIAQGSNVVALTGGGFPVQGIVTQNACLPDGCYRLRVLDAGGDGIAGGGYILRTQGTNQRVIDNRDNFTTGSVSAVIGNGGFCLPLGTDQLIYTSCDKLDWVNNQYIVAAPNAAVSAQWGIGDQTDDGYMFWFFDPNGTYGYAKFRSHATSDGFGPANATRACHARINNWSPNQIPANVLMNVKVRSRVNGVNSAWGPVCRFKIDPVRAACPLTKLMDIPSNQFFSCGVTKTWGGNSRIHARPVDGATQYQFRFNNGELGAPVVRTTTNYYLNLNWTPALPNGTYEVQVRAFKNGAWCVTSLPWGDLCNVTITGSQTMALPGTGTTTAAELAMFPNNGDQLTLSLSAVEDGVETVSVDIFDLSGARVVAKVIPVNDGMIYQQMAVSELASGLYTVNITAGSKRYTERLVITK